MIRVLGKPALHLNILECPKPGEPYRVTLLVTAHDMADVSVENGHRVGPHRKALGELKF